ncbi:MAG TPA: helix-turn-helix transcriptional regulator [Streptosporangiaceae bacterium]
MADDSVVATARRALGRQLAARRGAIGTTQAALAARLGYSRSTIANVETGRQRMSVDFWRSCDAAVSASGALVAAACDLEDLASVDRRHRVDRAHADADSAHTLRQGFSPEPAEEDDVERRALLELLAALGVGGTIPVDALERLRYGLEASIEPREDFAVEDWERIATEYGHCVVVQPAKEVIGDLAADIYEIHRLVKRTKAPLRRAELMRVSARLSALMADELHSLGKFGPAWRWWRTARSAADHSGDRDLRVWVLAREAINAFNSMRPTQSVLTLSTAAVRLAGGSASAGLAEAHKNRAYGMMKRGDEISARAALQDMRTTFEALSSHITSDEDSIWGWPERIMYMADSWVYTSFAAPEASSAQERALSLYPPQWHTEVTRAKLFQSITLIRDRDPAGGLEHAMAALATLPDDSHRRRPSILRLVGQLLDVLPDDRARALPAARDLRAITDTMAS